MRKSIFKFIATAAAISMIATAGSAMVSAADDSDVKEYEKFNYTLVDGSAIITGYTDKEATTLDIISEVKDGDNTYPVEGVQDLAFANLDNLTAVNGPASLKKDKIGSIAFVTKKSIEKFINNELGAEPKEEDVLAYVAKAVKYAGKTEGWTEDELKAVKEKTTNALVKAGIPAADITAEKLNADMVVTVLKNMDKLGVTAATAEAIDAWADTVKIYDIKLEGPEGSDFAAYIDGLKDKLATSFLLGDIDEDGELTVRDCAKLARLLAPKDVDTDKMYEENPHYDYNQDKQVSVRDAAAIASFLAKQDPTK